jgi:hypothetical protein
MFEQKNKHLEVLRPKTVGNEGVQVDSMGISWGYVNLIL